MWQHNYEPLGGSVGVSALGAVFPIAVLFFMIGVRRKPAWMAAATALISALVVALVVYGMPVRLAITSAIFGAAFGIFPLTWICFSSILLYRLAVDTGKFEIIKDSVGGLTNDRRLQAMFIAFSFGAFIEGAAGFGAPVAVSGAMLAGLGFSPFYAAGICLLGNTTPVAFGSLGIPVTTLANITGLPVLQLSAMVGRLCAMVSVFVPAYLVVVMTGPRRALEVLPAIIACGASFAGMQFYVSNYWGPELTDIASSLTCIGVMVLVLKIWKPRSILRLEGDTPITSEAPKHSAAEVAVAWLPYMLLVGCVVLWGAPSIKLGLNRWSDSLLPSFVAKSATGTQRSAGTGTSQRDHPDPTSYCAPRTVRRRIRVQLAERRRDRMFHGVGADSVDSACLSATVRQELRDDLQAIGPADADDFVHAGSGVSDELFRNDVDTRSRARGDRHGLSVLQRYTWMAGRVSQRQ